MANRENSKKLPKNRGDSDAEEIPAGSECCECGRVEPGHVCPVHGTVRGVDAVGPDGR